LDLQLNLVLLRNKFVFLDMLWRQMLYNVYVSHMYKLEKEKKRENIEIEIINPMNMNHAW